MAASGKRKVIAQHELRRLMRNKQRETAARKTVESPLAKYPSVTRRRVGLSQPNKRKTPVLRKLESKRIKGHVVLGPGSRYRDHCSDSRKYDRSDWPAPLLNGQSDASRVTSPSVNPCDPFLSSICKKKLPSHLSEPGDSQSHKGAPRNAPSVQLLAVDYGEEEEDGESVTAVQSFTYQCMEIPILPPTAQDSAIPPDFFDSKTRAVSHSGSILKADIQEKLVERKENTAEALPEGFFDDPEVDAKVRKVDAPKDHLDKEWEEFQKEMRQVNSVS
ncbi:Zinc finger protein, partial [Pristimantis euphronides]